MTALGLPEECGAQWGTPCLGGWGGPAPAPEVADRPGRRNPYRPTEVATTRPAGKGEPPGGVPRHFRGGVGSAVEPFLPDPQPLRVGNQDFVGIRFLANGTNQTIAARNARS
ncbi:hypothetical protein GCM10028793_17560 [Nocardiopsis oceani]